MIRCASLDTGRSVVTARGRGGSVSSVSSLIVGGFFAIVAPLRVRGLERVALHADLTMLARLSQALARARAVPLAA